MELHLVGGFLGSGKSTAIIQAARSLTAQGLRVGIITNEQGKHLVDTAFLRAHNLPALDVTGGCFCCHLDDFSNRLEELAERFSPQVIFAESVGSCTDLVATVIKPLLEWRETSALPSSLSVFSDSRLLLRYLSGQELPFNESVMYIFQKQIEETNLLVLNKIDLLAEDDVRILLELAGTAYPGKTLLAQNSLDSRAVGRWLRQMRHVALGLPTISLDLDYDAYASGEGRFAWLEREYCILIADQSHMQALMTFLLRLAEELPRSTRAIAHLKCFISDGQQAIKLSLTGMDNRLANWQEGAARLGNLNSGPIRLMINMMLEGEMRAAREALDKTTQRYLIQLDLETKELSAFERVPGYPKPTVRIGN